MLFLIIITIIEVIYVYYMLNFFKTKYSIHHPLEYIIINKLSDYYRHPIYSDEYSNKICPFGHFASNILVIYLILRCIIYIKLKNKILNNANIAILIITFILSLLNMNAFIYLLPYFITELYNIYNYFS